MFVVTLQDHGLLVVVVLLVKPGDEVLARDGEVLSAAFTQETKECELNLANIVVRDLNIQTHKYELLGIGLPFALFGTDLPIEFVQSWAIAISDVALFLLKPGWSWNVTAGVKQCFV